MVLELISSLKGAEKHPVSLFFIAFIITTAAMFIAYRTFPSSSSVLTVAFVAFAFIPIMHALFLKAEIKEVNQKDVPFAFIATHFDVIHIYSWIFIGMIAAFSFWAVVLPETSEGCTGYECLIPTQSAIFEEQNKVYRGITGKVVGEKECFSDASKSFGRCFELIVMNNFWVMGFAILFSFIWGAGAIFLLGWQASVIGLFIGLEVHASSIGGGLVRAISFLPHGIPEILAYFIAAIAGGIISATISKQKFQPHEIRIVMIDTVLLFGVATITLLIGAFIETASIFGFEDMALLGIIGFFALFTILYIPGVRYRLNKIREQN